MFTPLSEREGFIAKGIVLKKLSYNLCGLVPLWLNYNKNKGGLEENGTIKENDHQ